MLGFPASSGESIQTSRSEFSATTRCEMKGGKQLVACSTCDCRSANEWWDTVPDLPVSVGSTVTHIADVLVGIVSLSIRENLRAAVDGYIQSKGTPDNYTPRVGLALTPCYCEAWRLVDPPDHLVSYPISVDKTANFLKCEGIIANVRYWTSYDHRLADISSTNGTADLCLAPPPDRKKRSGVNLGVAQHILKRHTRGWGDDTSSAEGVLKGSALLGTGYDVVLERQKGLPFVKSTLANQYIPWLGKDILLPSHVHLNTRPESKVPRSLPSSSQQPTLGHHAPLSLALVSTSPRSHSSFH
mmetsp:Transcript_26880/g.67564  ORF Transcript_26880/g.67564 Transcript_26880/m.67564 type:complete len:300 (+) Transcript_26880:1154-2053(+)